MARTRAGATQSFGSLTLTWSIIAFLVLAQAPGDVEALPKGGAGLGVRAAPVDVMDGPAEAIDGDTLSVAGRRLRLLGIDAPEMAQLCRAFQTIWPCGRRSRDHLAGLIGDGPVRCEVHPPPSAAAEEPGLPLAVCIASGDPTSLNARMTRDGMAVPYVRHSDDYLEAVVAAKRLKRGMWAGEFISPWHWRNGMRLTPRPTDIVRE